MVGNTDTHLRARKPMLQKKRTHTSLFSKCKGSLKLQKQEKKTKTKKKTTSNMLKTDWSFASGVQRCARNSRAEICTPFTQVFHMCWISSHLFVNIVTRRRHMQKAVIFRFQKDDKWIACWESNGLNCLKRKNSPWQKYALDLAAYY